MRRALALLFLFALCACSGSELNESDALFRVSDDSGVLVVPVRGSDAAGKRYRLRNATFEVSGTAMVTMSNLGADARTPQLTTPLPTGSYQVFLRPGYELVEEKSDGSQERVTARLSSPNPLQVHIGMRAGREVTLAFRHDGIAIALGAESARPVAQRLPPAAVLARAP